MVWMLSGQTGHERSGKRKAAEGEGAVRVVLAIISGWFVFTVCESPFATRQPEPPINPQSGWRQPLSPEQTVQNLQNAVFERNVENVIRCIVDPEYSDQSYHFEADPEVLSVHSPVFIDWSREKEQAVVQQVFSYVPKDSASFLLMTDQIWEMVVPDNAILAARYQLELHHTQSNLSTRYEGYMTLWLSPDRRGEWAITRWRDQGISGFSSWSLLKATLGG